MIDLDRERLLTALTLAHGAIGLSDPNPRVGCVLGFHDGTVLATGFTQAVGGLHAEASALAAAHASGRSVRGATAWVTLEPCAHHGRTPPCCDALIDAGIARVAVAICDPNPEVNGAGIARMRAAGLIVDLADADIASQARELNIGFFSRMQRGRPWVRLKVAASLDGRTALPNGKSQWLTGAEAREDGHAWRKRASAIITGIGTVIADNPRLNVRHVPTHIQPMRVVLDSHLRIAPDAKVLKQPGTCLVVTAASAAEKAESLRRQGIEVIQFAGDDGRVDLKALLRELSQRGINELHVEAGASVNAALLRDELVDELLVYFAPTLVGPGLGIAALDSLESLADRLVLRIEHVAMVGADICVRARPLYSAAPGGN